MDESIDLYADLGVFGNKEKQVEKNADYLELLDKLKKTESEIAQLQEENENLKKLIVKHQSAEEILEKNGSSLLLTAKSEIKRKDDQIQSLRKEKDNIVFRRKDRLQKNIQTKNATIQTQITCKPTLVYELKRIDNESIEKSSEKNLRRDENHKNNPLASKSNNTNDNETKINHKSRDDFAEKNNNHRHQLRSQDEKSSRPKFGNQRNREDERQDQTNVDRSKRRRSRSVSRDRKRLYRGQSRSLERRRDRREERNLPDRGSRNQSSRTRSNTKEQTQPQNSKRSTNKLDSKNHDENKYEANISKLHLLKNNLASKSRSKEKEINATEQNTDFSCKLAVANVKMHIKTENIASAIDIEKPVVANLIPLHSDDALEDGELEDESDHLKSDTEEVKPKSQMEHVLKFEIPKLNDVPKIVIQNDEVKEEEKQEITTENLVVDMDIELQIKEDIRLEKGMNDEILIHSPKKIELIQPEYDTTKIEEPTSRDQVSNNINEENQSTERITIENIDLHSTRPMDLAKNDKNNKPNFETKDSMMNLHSEDLQKESSPILSNSSQNKNEPIEIKLTTDSTNQNSTKMTLNETLDTSGSKLVKSISTSSKDYQIFEDENNETIIYVTRKKKKKKQKSSKIV